MSGTNTVSYVTVAGATSIGLFTLTPIGTRSQSWFVSAAPRTPDDPEAEERALAYQDRLADAAHLLLDQARVLEGEPLPDPAAFARRLESVIASGLRVSGG